MTTETRDYERAPGYYWVRVLEPLCDGGGVVDERWSEPLVALLENNRWWIPSSSQPVVFDVEVLGRVPPFEGKRG